ncbi:MAG: flagellar type III secretion system pore protein FliP [Sphingomonas sp.]
MSHPVTITRLRGQAGPSLFAQPARRQGSGRGAKIVLMLLALLLCVVIAAPSFAQTVPAPNAPATVAAPATPGVGDAIDRALGDLGKSSSANQAKGGAPMALSLQILIIMGLLTVLPGILLMMTSFTRIIIVLSILRQALGLQQTPPNQVLVGLSLFLSFFIMSPVISRINTAAIQPYSAGQIGATDMIRTAGGPLHDFMIKQTRNKDITMFAEMAHAGPFQNTAQVPFSILLPSFVTSELKTAFQIGFLIFLPFIVNDHVVATVLMSLGMMMLSPTIISLPFKLLLFVLVDGWALTMGSLANSFMT